MRVWLVALTMALVSSCASAAEIRVMAAGSLRDVFAAVFADYAKLYGGSFAPVWGPSGVLRERLQKAGRDPKSVDHLFVLIRRSRRPLDFLINNAGIGHPNRSVSELPYPMWAEVIDTNLTGMFLVTQAALAVMKRPSTIVNNLSIAAERVFPGSAAYNASKHGALGFTDTLREELRPKGIRVIALMPGATDTAIWNSLWPKAPRRKMMSTDTVAGVVLNALLVPENSTVEKIVIMPAGGAL